MTIGLSTAVFVVSLLFIPHIGAEFMPKLDEGAQWVRATMPYTISFEESSRVVPQVTSILRSFPEVTVVASEHGRPDDGTDPDQVPGRIALTLCKVHGHGASSVGSASAKTRDSRPDRIAFAKPTLVGSTHARRPSCPRRGALEQLIGGAGRTGFGKAEVPVSADRSDPSARRALQHPLLDQVRLHHVFQRVALLAHRGGQIVDSHRAPAGLLDRL